MGAEGGSLVRQEDGRLAFVPTSRSWWTVVLQGSQTEIGRILTAKADSKAAKKAAIGMRTLEEITASAKKGGRKRSSQIKGVKGVKTKPRTKFR